MIAPAGVALRRAGPADAAALAAVAARLFRDTYRDDHSAADIDAYVAEHLTPERLAAELGDGAGAVFLAFDPAGEPLGYAQLRDDGAAPAAVRALARHPVELGRLYVDARAFGTGVAAALLGAVMDEARRRGADLLWLVVWHENARAKRFYGKHGFRYVGPERFRVGAAWYEDDCMVRPLEAET